KTSPDASGSDREVSEECDEFVFDTIQELKTNPDIDAVVTASLGSSEKHYMENGETASDSEKIEAIDQMWQEWGDGGKDVVVMAEARHFGGTKAPSWHLDNTCAV